MPDPGRNQEVDVAQLADELLEISIPIHIEDPIADEEFHLTPYVRWPVDILELRAKAVGGGEAFVQILLSDNPVEFEAASGGALINTAGAMRARSGDVEVYDATGGSLTSGADSNEAEVGDTLKLKFESADTPTDGLVFVGDLLLRRRRNVEGT